MNWTVAQIHRRLVHLDESDRIEAKAGLGDAAMKTVSAFSNEVGLRGGWIVFGVERQDDGTYLTAGVKHPDRLQTELATQCRGVFNRVVDVSIQVDEVDGKRLVVAFIPEAPPGDKPVYIKKMGLPKGAFRRVGSADCALSDHDLHRLASLANSTPFDRRPARGARREDLDPQAIEAYRRQLQTGRPGSELLLMGDDDLLEAVGALDGGLPTHAGLVLFGTRGALRRLLPALRVDVLTSQVPALGDTYEAVEVREALVTGWQRAFQAVSDTLPRRVTLSDASMRRVETSRVPDLALREAIVNALIHRDLEVGSAIQIRKFPDRLEIANPGYSLAEPSDWEHSRSIARNTTIAQVFAELGLAETRGTGLRRIRTRMAAAGLAPPELVSDREANAFQLTLKFHHLLDEADWTWLEQFRGLDDGDRQVLVVAGQRRIRNEDVRAITGEDVLGVSQRLARLRDAGVLDQHGASKAETWYALSARAQPSNLHAEPSNLDAGLSCFSEQESNLGPRLFQVPAERSNLGSEPSNLGSEPSNLGSEPRRPKVSPELADAIDALRPRAPREEVEALVLALCRLGWWEPTDLALTLRLSRRYFALRYLQPMVADGRLRLRYPDAKHNPRQAYTAADAGSHEDSR